MVPVVVALVRCDCCFQSSKFAADQSSTTRQASGAAAARQSHTYITITITIIAIAIAISIIIVVVIVFIFEPALVGFCAMLFH